MSSGADQLPVLITLHPSALLRLREEAERAAGFDALVHDLRIAVRRLESA